MERYENGKIYKLVNDNDDEIYVGSTCLMLAKRKFKHKSRANQRPQQKVYKHLNNIGWDNVHIVLIESFPCDSKMELEKRERYWIDQLHPTLNRNKPGGMPYDEFRACHNESDRKRRLNKWTCDECNCAVIRQPNDIKRHKETNKHRENFSKFMNDTLIMYSANAVE